MTDDIVEYEFEELEDGTPVGVSTVVGDNSMFLASEDYTDGHNGKQRKRLTEDFEDIEVAIPKERYIADSGSYDHVLNEDYEKIENGKFANIELVTDKPGIAERWRTARDTVLSKALEDEFGELDDINAVYAADGHGGFESSILVDDGEEVVEAVYLGDLGMEDLSY